METAGVGRGGDPILRSVRSCPSSVLGKNFSWYLSKYLYLFWLILFLFFSWTPITCMLDCLILTYISLTFHFFLLLLFCQDHLLKFYGTVFFSSIISTDSFSGFSFLCWNSFIFSSILTIFPSKDINAYFSTFKVFGCSCLFWVIYGPVSSDYFFLSIMVHIFWPIHMSCRLFLNQMLQLMYNRTVETERNTNSPPTPREVLALLWVKYLTVGFDLFNLITSWAELGLGLPL